MIDSQQTMPFNKRRSCWITLIILLVLKVSNFRTYSKYIPLKSHKEKFLKLFVTTTLWLVNLITSLRNHLRNSLPYFMFFTNLFYKTPTLPRLFKNFINPSTPLRNMGERGYLLMLLHISRDVFHLFKSPTILF